MVLHLMIIDLQKKKRTFIIDECDNMLDQIDMRKLVCRKFTKNAKEIFVD